MDDAQTLFINLLICGLALSYLVKGEVFRSLYAILKHQDSTEPLGVAIANHYKDIRNQAYGIFGMMTFFALRSFELIPFYPIVSILVYVVGLILVFTVIRSGVRLLRIAQKELSHESSQTSLSSTH